MIKDIKQLIEMKEQIDKRKNETKNIYIPSLDTEFKIRLATRPEMVNISQMELVDQDPYLVYTHVIEPDLNNKELQETYNRKSHRPHEILDEIILPAEVAMLSNAIAGNIKDANIVKDIKN